MRRRAASSPRAASVWCSSDTAHDGQAPSLTPTRKIGGQRAGGEAGPRQMAAPTLYCCFFDSSRREGVPSQGVRSMHALLARGNTMCLWFRLSRSDSERGACRQRAGRCDRSVQATDISRWGNRGRRGLQGVSIRAGRSRLGSIEDQSLPWDLLRRDGAEAGQGGGRGGGWQHLLCSRRQGGLGPPDAWGLLGSARAAPSLRCRPRPRGLLRLDARAAAGGERDGPGRVRTLSGSAAGGRWPGAVMQRKMGIPETPAAVRACALISNPARSPAHTTPITQVPLAGIQEIDPQRQPASIDYPAARSPLSACPAALVLAATRIAPQCQHVSLQEAQEAVSRSIDRSIDQGLLRRGLEWVPLTAANGVNQATIPL